MGWRRDEVWFDLDVLWFREQPRSRFGALSLEAPSFGTFGLDLPFSIPVATGIEASRARRSAAQAARRRRLATRTVPALALVLGSSTMLPIAAFRHNGGSARPLQEDPPSLSFRLGLGPLAFSEAPFLGEGAFAGKAPTRRLASASKPAEVAWRKATSTGLPYSGHLVDGTQLPLAGPDWVTWNPVTDSVPNLPDRLYGNEHTIRAILSVIEAYRDAHVDAARVVVGDISFRDGGTMDQHVSHQNGLDVDVYYPRLDRHESAPIATGQIDRRLSQDLLDRFVKAGAQIVFVGYSTGLHGRGGVVVPYPNHENHMHVRFHAPAG